MPASVKEFRRQLVAGKFADRTKRYLDYRFFGIFAQEAGETNVLDRERNVDKAFAVAFHIVKLALLFFGQCNQGRITIGINPHVGQDVAHQSQPALRVGVVHFPVNIVLVYSFREQFADNEINLPVVRVISKSARIGHHAGVNTFGSLFRDVAEIAHAADKAKHQLGSRRNNGIRHGDPAKIVRIQVVIDQYLAGGRRSYGIFHRIDALQGVEIQAANHIRLGNQFIGKVFVTIVQQNIFATRHPFQEVGESVGNYHMDRFLLRFKKMVQP